MPVTRIYLIQPDWGRGDHEDLPADTLRAGASRTLTGQAGPLGGDVWPGYILTLVSAGVSGQYARAYSYDDKANTEYWGEQRCVAVFRNLPPPPYTRVLYGLKFYFQDSASEVSAGVIRGIKKAAIPSPLTGNVTIAQYKTEYTNQPTTASATWPKHTPASPVTLDITSIANEVAAQPGWDRSLCLEFAVNVPWARPIQENGSIEFPGWEYYAPDYYQIHADFTYIDVTTPASVQRGLNGGIVGVGDGIN